MAVTPVLVPDLYALTRSSRTLYRFTGSGRAQTQGVKAINGLTVLEPVPAGTVLKLSWNGQTQTLTARTSPTLPNEFPAGNGSLAYGDTLLNYFKSYFPFRKDFVATKIDFGLVPLIILTARQAGAAYTISQVLQPGLGALPPVTGPISLGVDTAGADPLIRERYGVYLEVYLQRAGTSGESEADYDLIDTPHIECDADGIADYDVGDILHDYLSADIPDFSAQGGQLALDSHRKYYVAYAEAYGQPVQPGLIQQDIVRHAYLGGADFFHRAGSGFNLSTFLLGLSPAGDKAMRFGSSTRVVRIDEPQFLSFVNLRESPDQVTLKVTMTFDDESTAGMTGIQAVVPYAPGAKICFPVGVAILDLLSQVPAGKFLKEYSVQLKGQDDALLSRAYRYIVEYDLPDYRRYFVYLNSLGAFSSLLCYGKGSRELTRLYDQSERFLSYGYEPTDAQYVEYNTTLQQTFEVASGWQDQKELASWDDFYRSPVRLLVVGTRVYAIGLLDKSIKQFKDGDAQFAHLLRLAYLHLEEFYTDTDTPDGDEQLPTIALPAGTVVVSPLQITPVTDPTVPNFVRELTLTDINGFKAAAARPNPETLGFLTQTSGNALYRRSDLHVPYADISNTPTTRDQAGLLDVPTVGDLFQLINIRPLVLTWDGDIPAELQ